MSKSANPNQHAALRAELHKAFPLTSDRAGQNGVAMADAFTSMEVARMLGVSRSSVAKWITAGHLAAERFSRHWRIPISTVEQVIERGADGNAVRS